MQWVLSTTVEDELLLVTTMTLLPAFMIMFAGPPDVKHVILQPEYVGPVGALFKRVILAIGNYALHFFH